MIAPATEPVPADLARKVWLDSHEAAAYTGFEEQTLRHWRSQGRGPRYSKLSPGRTGRIRYLRSDLDRYMRDRASRTP